jgi:hypothetical protein
VLTSILQLLLCAAPAEDDVERGLQRLDCVRKGDGHSSKADVGGDVADGVHGGRAKDLAKLLLADALQDTVAGQTR